MKTSATFKRLKACGVVPVVTINEASHAIPLAQALVEGGLDVIEVTLRTACALEAIREIRQSALDITVGAGTILREGDVDAAQKAGADFLVTPAVSPQLVPALLDFDGLVLPGVSTPSEILSRIEEGFEVLKFFPAEQSGGVGFLKAISGPIPSATFMPTGGITPDTARHYLDLPNVVAIGGSWIAPQAVMASGDWQKIAALARTSSHLAQSAIE